MAWEIVVMIIRGLVSPGGVGGVGASSRMIHWGYFWGAGMPTNRSSAAILSKGKEEWA